MHKHRSIWIILTVLVVPSILWAGTSPQIWSQRFGDDFQQGVVGLVTDNSANVYVTGYFLGSVDFGGGALASAGGYDIFVAKYDRFGNHIWSQRFGDSTDQQGLGIELDSTGNVLCTGDFEGTVDFGGTPLVSAGAFDIYLVKFDSAGNHIWSKSFGDGSVQRGTRLGTDANNNVYIHGRMSGTVDFGGTPLTSAGGEDVFLAKFESNGSHVWSKHFGDSNDQISADISVTSDGDIAITGYYLSSVDFGGGSLVSAGGWDVYVAKFDTDGNHIWSDSYGDLETQIACGIVIDEAGNLAITGYYTGNIDFGGGPLTCTGYSDIYLAKLRANGTHVWSQHFGDSNDQIGADISVTSAGEIAVAGQYIGSVDFGGGPLVSAGGWDICVARFDSTGFHLWSEGFGDASYFQYATGVSFDGNDHMILAGEFEGTVDFGGGPLVSAGSRDIFLAKFRFTPEPIITAIEDVENDQGRNVRITFVSSLYDSMYSPMPIVQYEAFRRIDPLTYSSAGNSQEEKLSSPMLSKQDILLNGWEYVGSIPAHTESEYNMIVPTLADSTISNGMHWSVFFIRAATEMPWDFFDSAPDSGYSLDNLAPFAPSGFGVAYNTGNGNELAWDESIDEDFQYFCIYRGSDPDFTPSESNLIHTTISTQWNDPEFDGWDVYYKISAVDFSGNESVPCAPEAMTGASDKTIPKSYALYQNIPNPFNPSTMINYSVPVTAWVNITIYDAAGRTIKTLVNAFKSPGSHTTLWDGTDNEGYSSSSGVYFCKMVAGEFKQTKKLVLLK